MTFAPSPVVPSPRFAKMVLAILLAASVTALAGCASNHPITKAGEACASCHSDGRVAASSPDLSSATETGLTFAVESSADEVHLCTAQLAENGQAIPAKMRTLAADELSSVTVSEPGLYALCEGDVAGPSKIVLVNVTESGPANTAMKL